MTSRASTPSGSGRCDGDVRCGAAVNARSCDCDCDCAAVIDAAALTARWLRRCVAVDAVSGDAERRLSPSACVSGRACMAGTSDTPANCGGGGDDDDDEGLICVTGGGPVPLTELAAALLSLEAFASHTRRCSLSWRSLGVAPSLVVERAAVWCCSICEHGKAVTIAG